jgi:carbonic anhydrase
VHSVSRETGSEYAVIGVILNDSALTPNSAFSELLDDLPAADDWEEQELNINFDWSEIISGLGLEYYWSYTGSFTTPDCSEDVQWIVLRDFVEVTRFQIEQIMNISGFNNNFRPPAPWYGRVVQDGSEIVSSIVTWSVIICCVELKDINIITRSVSRVLGLSEEDVKINDYSLTRRRVATGRSLDIEYEITVIENTKTFLTNLIQNLNDEDSMVKMIAQIEPELKSIEVSVSDTDVVSVNDTVSDLSWHYPYNVSEWGNVAEICEYGTMQSPIDLPTHRGIKQKQINATFGVPSNLIASRGHSLKWSLATKNYPALYLSGLKYELVQ